MTAAPPSPVVADIVTQALRSDERYVVLHQTETMFRATAGQLHSEVQAVLETFHAEDAYLDGMTAVDFALAYATRRLEQAATTLRDLARMEQHLRAAASRSLMQEFS